MPGRVLTGNGEIICARILVFEADLSSNLLRRRAHMVNVIFVWFVFDFEKWTLLHLVIFGQLNNAKLTKYSEFINKNV